MITVSNTIKLITLTWLMNIQSAGYCKAENSELDCILGPHRAIKGITSITGQKDIQGVGSSKIRMVNKCAKGYENKDIIEKCENLINRNRLSDTELYQPVIDNITNETYWNTYCATCNNDTVTKFSTFLPWSIFFEGKSDACEKYRKRIIRSEVDDIYNLTRIFISEGVKLVAERFNDTQLECSMNGKWPIHLIFNVIPCLYNYLHNGQETRLDQCQYAEKTGRICTRMRLSMEGLSFNFINKNKEVDYNETLPEYKYFTPGQYYVETEYPGVFYICDQPATIYGGMNSVKISIAVISLIFITINILLYSNKRYLQKNTTSNCLCLYMIELVTINIRLLSMYLSHPVPCVAFYLAQFLWAFHFVWSMLIFIEFCLLAGCTLSDRIVVGLRYVYFMFGIAILLGLPIIYNFGVLVPNEDYKEDLYHPDSLPDTLQYTCPKIPDHLGVYCSSNQKFGSEYYEKWLEIILSPIFHYFMPTLFLFISVAVLYNFLNYRSDRTRSNPYRGDLMVLTKMTLIMGIHWLLFMIYQSYGSDYSVRILGVSLDTLCQLSIDFHGTIVFIVFGAETCIGFIMNMFGCKSKSVSQQDGKDGMEIS